jgi:hypothetical protein
MKYVYILPRFAFMLAGLLFVVSQADESVSTDYSIPSLLLAIVSEQESIRILRCWLYR